MNKIAFISLISFSSAIQAKSLFQDPNRNDFNAAWHSYKKADIVCLPNCKTDNDKKNFVVAFLHILKNNNNKLDIEHSCPLGVSKLQAMSKSKINDASYELSKLYYYGVCVPVDIKQSENLLKKAAENNYVPALRLLGIAYGRKDIQSALYSQDYRQSLKWLLKAAKAGDGKSAAMVSTYFKKGLGVEVNEKKSYEWAVKTINSKYPV